MTERLTKRPTSAEAVARVAERLEREEANALEQQLEIERARVKREWQRGFQMLGLELLRACALCGLIIFTCSYITS